MLYCDACGHKKGLPETIFRRNAKCEICNKEKLCNDSKSKPPAKKKKGPIVDMRSIT